MTITSTRSRCALTAVALVALVSLLGATACSSTGSDSDAVERSESTTTTDDSTDAPLPAPDEQGDYGVGRRVIELDDTERGRPLTADVWYPTDPDAEGDPSIYQFIPGIEFESKLALGDVAVSADGPFPLVIYSHGSGGLRYVASYFTELLASHGFVVAAVDHTGNTATESITDTEDSRDEISFNRVADVDFLIGEMISLSDAPDGAFTGTVDGERVGVSGHSYGGFTALAAAGGFTNAIGSIPPDERIDATASISGATRLNSDEALAAIKVPTLLVSGTLDETVPVDPATIRGWEHIAGRPLWRVDLEGAGHQSFTDVCDYQRLLPTLADVPQILIDAVDDFAEEGCTDELMPIEEAHRLSNRALIAFMLTYVAGDSGYDVYLSEALPDETVQVKE